MIRLLVRRINPFPLIHFESTTWRSPIFSRASRFGAVEESAPTTKDDLKGRIFRLIFPRRSATQALQDWVNEGHRVSVLELRGILKQLVKFKRYKHALEILKWLEDHPSLQMSADDHAITLDLLVKVHGLNEAEEYFRNIVNNSSKKAACVPLLRAYVKEGAIEKAEALMLKLNCLGLIVSPHPYNEMMKLYMARSQFEKVPLVIQQMKQNKIPRNVLSYNLWMRACGEVSGVASAEKVFKEMMNDKNVEVGWSTLSTLSIVYQKFGLVENAILALRNAESKLSTCNRLGYFFLITLYASLNNKEGVLRLWEASKAVEGTMTCANYMCVLSCLVKLSDLAEAERIFMEWEANCRRYDIRVSNVLLGAYVRNGLIDKAETLHHGTLERGGCPNYKTWEILMEGWVKSQSMDKAFDAMKKGFAMSKRCDWRPSHRIVMTIAEYLEKEGKFEDANHYLNVVHRLGLASLPLYKLILRMHLRDGKLASGVLKMMTKDEIEMDDEASALVQALNVELRTLGRSFL